MDIVTITLALAVQRQLHVNPSVGAVVGVVRDGKLVYSNAIGFRNVTDRTPVDVQTRFEIGSVTKQFTARTAILQLKEAGKLGLDDSLAKYLPSFPHASEITLRQLLNQVSGLPDFLRGKDFMTLSSTSDGSLEAIAGRVRGDLDFTPGTKWEYSNTNYYVLGRVIEIVSGQSYDEYVRQHLFARAGMEHSGFMQGKSMLDDVATGYSEGRGEMEATQPAQPSRESWAGGAGCIVSTLPDLVAWDNALADGEIVNGEDFALMSTPATLKDGTQTEYGMGLSTKPLAGHRRIWHNGGTNGFLAVNAMYPDDRVDIIALENDLSGDPDQMEETVFGALFPDAVASARRAAAGEDPAVRTLALRIIGETVHGAVSASDLAPEFQRFARPLIQQRLARNLAPFGAPTSVIYQSKTDGPNAERYSYRVEFGAYSALTFTIAVDKATNLVSDVQIDSAP